MGKSSSQAKKIPVKKCTVGKCIRTGMSANVLQRVLKIKRTRALELAKRCEKVGTLRIVPKRFVSAFILRCEVSLVQAQLMKVQSLRKHVKPNNIVAQT